METREMIELIKKKVKLASQDEKVKERIKNEAFTIVIICKDVNKEAFTFSINKGQMRFSEGRLVNPDFQFEVSRKDFFNLMVGRASHITLMTHGRMEMIKGSWGEIRKITLPWEIISIKGKGVSFL